MHFPCVTDVHQRSNTSQVSVNNSTGRFARQHCPRKGFGQAERYPGIICHPLRLHPERNRPVGQQWQMLPPSVPAGRPAASATIPAERVLPAAVAPSQTHERHETGEGERGLYQAIREAHGGDI